jgi:glycosyltransferase involved in cell wall biosynthesis
MKFMVYGNSPQAGTGYGVQINHLVTRLKREGHDVAVSVTFGHQVGVRKWATPYGDVTLYPSGYLENSVDVLYHNAMHFFGGDPKAGWIIPLTDMWALNVAPNILPLSEFNVLAWTPVDHFPCPEGVIKFFHRNPDAVPVAMSRFGERMFIEAGLNPTYAPLAVDTKVYKPTHTVEIDGKRVAGRTLFNIPQNAFAVLMVAMNKDPNDRKGFNEAFRAFGRFWKDHQDAVLVVHAEKFGIMGSGINLETLATHAAIPPHALIFTDQYAYKIGLSAEMMAALYTSCDVLLAPSKGEGFGVPMIEAQACGTPVIASDFTAQSELLGPAGWGVSGQLEWDGPQAASYLRAFSGDVYTKLHACYDHPDHQALSDACVDFAYGYDVDEVWAEHWKPILASLEPTQVAADKPPMQRCDVIVPLMRDENRARFLESFDATAPESCKAIVVEDGFTPTRTFAENINAGVAKSDADFVLIVGDDVEFLPGWFEEAQKLTDRYDVIGTNDSEPGRVRNPDVAAGRHADHFLIRRSYIEDEGASLDGPGVAMPECYGHWYTDKEVIELAKARGVFGFAEECRIVHHHPGYDGREDLRDADPVYAKAPKSSDADRKTFMSRVPLIQALRVSR